MDRMHDTLRCPGCKAELKLPALSTGQTVQCPRCQHTVDPARPFSTALKAHPPAASPVRAEATPLDDHLPDDLRTLLRPDPLHREWLAWLAMAILAVSVLSSLMLIGVSGGLVQLSDLAELDGRRDEWPIGRLARLFDRVTFWLAALAFLAWLYQASHNLKTLKSFGASHQPATAVLSFFTPIINFYWPYVIVQEIWQGSDPHAIDSRFAWFDVPASSTIRYWWSLFISSFVISWLSAFTNASVWFACIAHLLMASAGVLLIVIIHRIATRQRERWDRLYSDV